MPPSDFVFGLTAPTSQKPPFLAAVERRSEQKLIEDRAEAQRVREIAILAERPEKHPEVLAKWRNAVTLAEVRHVARVSFYRRHYIGLSDSTPEDPEHVKHAEGWLHRHLPEIEAAVRSPAQAPVSRFDWYGPEGLRERYLNKLAIAAAKADGHIFTEDF